MNRRDATKYLSAIGAAAIAMPGSWRAAAGERDQNRDPFCAVVLDGRYSDARSFAAALRGPATMQLTTCGDAVTLWMRDCLPRLSAPAWRMAGLTTHSDFTLLRACARESGAATLYEGLHDFRRAGRIRHVVRTGRAGATLSRALRQDDWTTHLARALVRTPLRALRGDESALRMEGGRAASDHPGTLVSWVIGRNMTRS